MICLIIALASFQACSVVCSPSCISEDGHPVDWFVVYKFPKLDEGLFTTGRSYAYLDSQSPNFVLSKNLVDSPSGAVARTLDVIYQLKGNGFDEPAHVLWNDQLPDGTVSFDGGHSKGVLTWDLSTGFWLTQSTPMFPSPSYEGFKWPPTGDKFGQSFLCVTVSSASIDDIAGQLMVIHPQLYDLSFPDSYVQKFPQMYSFIHEGSSVRDTNSTLRLFSNSGQEILHFAKSSLFGKDLYSDLVSSQLAVDLFVESWQHGQGKLMSSCSLYKVENNVMLNVMGSVRFSEMDDHSKWAVTQSSGVPYLCIGDINRMRTQLKRGGGSVCLLHAQAWGEFFHAITKVEKCTRAEEYHSHIRHGL